jgi:hypothetical protein
VWADAAYGNPDLAIKCGIRVVALVVDDEESPISREEQLANARLIAAAPELLASCRKMIDTMSQCVRQGGTMDLGSNEFCEIFRRAIGDMMKAAMLAEGRAE